MLNPKHPFYSANDFYREIFGEKIIKLAIDGGFTCPNRDGTLSYNGCIFCSGKGSGDFAGSRSLTISEQYKQMKEKMSSKWPNGRYMMYFQAYTNTYAPVEKLRKLYYEAIECEGVAALSVATRPDCINEEIMELLKEISKKVYVCVELGLQTSSEKSAGFINRCYDNNVYDKALRMLNEYGIDTVTHIILGLPHECCEDMLNSVNYAIDCGTKGIKLQLLHIIKGTALYDFYMEKPFKIFSLEDYVNTVVNIIEKIPQNIVIHRITGDADKAELFEPWWSLNKRRVLNSVAKEFVRRGSWQGKYSKH
ncbi:MAG: TIGR01212 family radical SAM protein [Clostridia bacterium]|nr:TIGR01212 family radical SAM protein [Clostridia bacterium]